MDFPADSFDIVFDKGCLDVIFCTEKCFENSIKVLKDIYKILKNKG